LGDVRPTKPTLLLASTSPRRRQLLVESGYALRVIPPIADESPPKGLCPAKVAEEIACRKAESVAQSVSHGLVLGADTLVALDDSIIGKPDSREHAITILNRLSGRSQLVITGLCLIDTATHRRRVASEITQVTMRPISQVEIEAYVDSGEAMGKAGAYAIQETGDRFVERIDGSFSNVVGLPLELLQRLLREMTSQQ